MILQKGTMDNKQYFDEVADQWDTMRESFFPESVRAVALAAAGVKPGDVAADLGAGSGFITEALFEAGAHVIAVDQSQHMLDVMQQKFGSGDYRLGDADNLPMEDAAVDHAFANMYLHHVEHPAQAIAEMARILRPGGKLVISDLDEHTFTFLREEHHDRWMGFKRADVQHWFEAAGLKGVSVTGIGSDCCTDSACGAERAEISIFIATGQKV